MYECLYRMPDESSEDELNLISKANAAKIKTQRLKKGLTKNRMAARKRDMLAQQIRQPVELLQSDETFEVILKACEEHYSATVSVH